MKLQEKIRKNTIHVSRKFLTIYTEYEYKVDLDQEEQMYGSINKLPIRNL